MTNIFGKNEAYKVLIVDDLPKNIMVLGNNLMNENYQIAYARSGKEAIELSQKNNFDLILLDVMMPEMDGYETCKRILEHPKTARVPIIFITAKNDYESIIKGFKVGAKDYVTKPFNSKELLARVRTHLELKRSTEALEDLNKNLESIVEERTEMLMDANHKLNQLDKAKSSFLGIISHEIRTPLNGIFGSVEMLKDIHEDEETEEIVQIISESADRLLKFSELSSLITELNIDHYRLKRDKVNLTDIINLVIKQGFVDVEEYSEVEIVFEQDKEEFIIDAEIKLIKKIVQDVIGNSIKFAEESVKISILIEQEEGFVSLKIHDNGIGFPKNILMDSLKAFQSDAETYYEGKGLSLAAAKLIMDAHSGDIEVYNVDTGGAGVCVKFKNKQD
ncbi:MAG: hybrid sensor histidine kinase/response regulator [Bacteroidales bacterium]|nr:hybrid sensor histidine kinase/response regulator [Bacteroidales bacterium]